MKKEHIDKIVEAVKANCKIANSYYYDVDWNGIKTALSGLELEGEQSELNALKQKYARLRELSSNMLIAFYEYKTELEDLPLTTKNIRRDDDA